MLSTSAFNAFLKTLEEPPPYCKFILATTEKHKILPTILSRCQIFDFKRISIDTIVTHLKHICAIEKIDAEEDALHIIAQKADGGMRDALSMFDRLSGFGNGKLTYVSVLENLNVLDYDYFFKATDALLAEDLSLTFQLFDQILKKGFEGDDFILGLCEHFRNLLFCKDAGTLKMLEVSENLKQKYAQQSTLASADFLVNCLNLGNQCDVQYRASKNKRLTVELALIKMCYVNAVVTVGDETGKKKLKPEPRQGQPVTKEQATVEREADVVNEESPPIPVKETVIKQIIETAPPVQKDTSGAGQKPGTPAKTKKFLSADALDALGDSPEKIAIQAEEEAEGEVLILNAENILKLWEEYAMRISETKKGLKIIFNTFRPLLDESVLNKVFVKVQSDIQKSQLEEIRNGLQAFVSKKVGAEIAFEIIADKEVVTGTKPYTPKEKLERLIQKNPAIKKLQQQLGLELDYD